MKRFRLLLLDANVVIELFRCGAWDQAIDQCDIHLGRTVAQVEAHFYLTDDGQRHDFDLRTYEAAKRITVFDVAACELTAFRQQFDPVYFEKLDPGETESLAYLLNLPRHEGMLCSADKIVFRVLGSLRRGEQGISLEEVLRRVGLGRSLPRHFSQAYREYWTRKGFEEGVTGIGLRN